MIAMSLANRWSIGIVNPLPAASLGPDSVVFLLKG
jgi:hypothetical protein